MKLRLLWALVAAAMLTRVVPAQAGTLTINLDDIDTSVGYDDFNTSDTFAGNGFVGIYPGASYGHLFGLEDYSGAVYSETEIEAELAGLAGVTVDSAYLDFSLLNGTPSPETIDVTSYSATGVLSFHSAPPDDLGDISATAGSAGANSIDVTSLVSAALAANQSWLGLYLTPQGPGDAYDWTYTYSGYGYDADSAQASLVINYTGSAPDQASTLLQLALGAGLLILPVSRRRRC